MYSDESQWQDTKTFFPLLLHRLLRCEKPVQSVCVVGASDGKFVIPLAEAGYDVEALEIDEVALYGGEIEFPEGNYFRMRGLKERLLTRNLENKVDIRNVDFIAPKTGVSCHGAVFTSCSWHYSRNHHSSLGHYVKKMQSMLPPGGIFCAEYMMPVEVKHFKTDHYVREGQLANLFPEQSWILEEDFYTQPFVEDPHVGNFHPHVHRMGFLMAVRK